MRFKNIDNKITLVDGPVVLQWGLPVLTLIYFFDIFILPSPDFSLGAFVDFMTLCAAFGAVWLFLGKKSIFIFDTVKRRISWQRKRFFVYESGEAAFDDIKDVFVESDLSKSFNNVIIVINDKKVAVSARNYLRKTASCEEIAKKIYDLIELHTDNSKKRGNKTQFTVIAANHAPSI